MSINLFDNYITYYPDGGDRYSTIGRDGNDNVKLINLDPSQNKVEASGLVIEENITDTDPSRACASQEEAFFRNYQWFFVDKKYVLIMPQRLTLVDVSELGVAYIYQEANGFYAFSNSRPFRGNHLWAKTGKSGSSNVPGDYRMGVVADLAYSSLLLGQSGDSTYNDTLRGGAGFSSVLAHNITSLVRMAFPFSPEVSRGLVTWKDKNGDEHTDAVTDNLVSSNAFTVGDSLWNRRNAFVPILMSLFNALRENVDNKHSNTTGLVPSFDMMTILLKPIAYYQQEGDTSNYALPPRKTWKFRVRGNCDTNSSDPYCDYFLKSGADFYTDATRWNKPETWFGSWRERDFYQMAYFNTPISILIDSNRYPSNSSDRKVMDGILPLLVAENPDTHARPKVLTQAFKLLMSLGKDTFDDDPTIVNTDEPDSQKFDETWQSWGTRRKLFYGLEQSSLLSKNTRGRFTQINDTNLTEILPDWMFTYGVDSDGDGMPDDMRPEEIFANTDQNILVGSNDYTSDIKPGDLGYQMGLAYMPTDWEKNPAKLTLFRTYLEMTSELLAPQGGAYSVVENLINVMDKFFNQVSPTDDQIKGLVHTLGIMATTYDKKNSVWNIPTGSWTSDGKISFDDPKSHWEDPNWVDDMYRVAAQYQPILNAIALKLDGGMNLSDIDPAFVPAEGGLTSTIHYIYDSSVYFNALFNQGGLIEYVLDVVDTTDKFSEIFSELYTFLGEPLLTTFNSTLWSDVAKLMSGQVQVLTRNDSPRLPEQQFPELWFSIQWSIMKLT